MFILPYLKLLRLHQPTGVFLLLWPCLWGVALAGGAADLGLTFLFIIGSIVMRGAGCIINDLADIEFDKKVERTKNRPLASGAISKSHAYFVLILMLSIGLCVLFFLNRLAITIALFSMVLVVAYPFMKRITYWPQLFLGFTFNVGVLIGYAQVADRLDLSAFILYLAGIFWTLGYDTIYGYQDIRDDLKIGVKSSAIAISGYPKLMLAIFYSLMSLLLIVTCKIMLFLPVFALLIWQIYSLDVKSPANCLVRFKSNIYVGLLVYLALGLV